MTGNRNQEVFHPPTLDLYMWFYSLHPLSLSHTHTHSLSLPLSLTHTHSLSLSHTLSLSLSLSHTHTHTHTVSLSHTHTYTLSVSLSLSFSLSLTHTHTHIFSLSLSQYKRKYTNWKKLYSRLDLVTRGQQLLAWEWSLMGEKRKKLARVDVLWFHTLKYVFVLILLPKDVLGNHTIMSQWHLCLIIPWVLLEIDVP